MNILGFIPARGGSRGIPCKNIHPLAGNPLISYTIQAALLSRITKLIVSTDSEEIADISRHFGAEVPFLRPKELAGEDNTIEEALAHAMNELGKSGSYTPDIIVLLHPTTPMRTGKHIDDSIELLLKNEADSVVSVSEPMEHPAEMVYWDKDQNMHFLLEDLIVPGKTQRQAYPKCYFLNGVVYTFTYESFCVAGSRFGKRNLPYVMRQIDSIDIDSMDDLYIAESILLWKKDGQDKNHVY